MSVLIFCSLKLQNKHVIFGNIQKFLSSQTYSLPSHERLYRIANLRYFVGTNVLLKTKNDGPKIINPTKMALKADGTVVERPKTVSPIILLEKLNGNVEKLSLSDADRFAKRNNLTLEKIEDGVKFPKYRVVEKNVQFKEEKNEQKGEKKKIIIIRTRSTQHDIETKINYTIKLLGKNKGVSLQIIADDGNLEKTDEILNLLMKNAGNNYKLGNKKMRKNISIIDIIPQKLPNEEDVKK